MPRFCWQPTKWEPLSFTAREVRWEFSASGDLIQAVADGADFGETRVRDYMSISPVRIEHNAPLEEGIAEMSDLGVRHLAVVHQGEVVGIVSARDILRALKGKNLGSSLETKGRRASSLKLVNPC